MSTHLANRVRHMLCDRNDWHRFPDDVSEWLEVQDQRSVHPRARATAGRDLRPPRPALHGRLQLRRLERAPVAGHADHPADGDARASSRWASSPTITASPATGSSRSAIPQALVLPRHPGTRVRRLGREQLSAQDRLPRSRGDRRAGRAPPSRRKRKTGRQVSFSTDLIYDVLRRYEPEHLLLRAAWNDARARMTELGRLVRLVDRAAATMVHVEAERITPMAVPLMVIVGREALPPGGEADESLLIEAEALAHEAMRDFDVATALAGAILRRHESLRRSCRLRCRSRAAPSATSQAPRSTSSPCRSRSLRQAVDLGHHQPVRSRPEARARASQGRRAARPRERVAERCNADGRCRAIIAPLVAARMRYFLDTEFNGFGGALLSLALVPDDGEELYLTLADRRPDRRGSSGNVMPYLDHVPEQLSCPRLSRPDAAHELWRYLPLDNDAADRRRLARGYRPILQSADHRPGRDGPISATDVPPASRSRASAPRQQQGPAQCAARCAIAARSYSKLWNRRAFASLSVADGSLFVRW